MLKRATRWHPGAWRTTFICNWVTAALFLPVAALLLPVFGFGGQIPLPWLLWQPAVASYAMFDVLVQHWAPARGVGRFMPLTMIAGAVVSLGLMIGFDDGS